MLQTKSAEESHRRWVFKSIEAYLDGEKDLKWILGVIGKNPELALELLQERLPHYGLVERREELKRELEKRL